MSSLLALHTRLHEVDEQTLWGILTDHMETAEELQACECITTNPAGECMHCGSSPDRRPADQPLKVLALSTWLQSMYDMSAQDQADSLASLCVALLAAGLGVGV